MSLKKNQNIDNIHKLKITLDHIQIPSQKQSIDVSFKVKMAGLLWINLNMIEESKKSKHFWIEFSYLCLLNLQQGMQTIYFMK